MRSNLTHAGARSLLSVAVALGSPIVASTEEESNKMLRSEVEAELPPIEAAYRAAPGDVGNRRAYAEILHKLGNVWQAKYACTKGEYVHQPLGVADTVTMGEVALENVPVIVARWKAMGPTRDGVLTTQILKRFLSTVDYEEGEINLRERSDRGKQQLLASFAGEPPIQIPVRSSRWCSIRPATKTRGTREIREIR